MGLESYDIKFTPNEFGDIYRRLRDKQGTLEVIGRAMSSRIRLYFTRGG